VIQELFPNELKEVTTITKGSINQLSRLLNQWEKFKDIKPLSPMDKDLHFIPHITLHTTDILYGCMSSTPLLVHAPAD